MSNLAAEYEKRTAGEGTAPSGQLFRWRTARPADTAAVFGAMPNVGRIKEGEIDQAALVKSTEFNEKLAVRCVTYPRIVLNGDAPTEEDWLPAAVIDNADMNWLIARIMGAYRSQASEDAKEAL